MLTIFQQAPRQMQRSLCLLNLQMTQPSISMGTYKMGTLTNKNTSTFNPIIPIRKLSNKKDYFDNGDILSEVNDRRNPRVRQNHQNVLVENVLCDIIEPDQLGEVMEKIKSASNANDLLLCYIENSEYMNEKHLVEIFNMMDAFVLKGEVNHTRLKANKIYWMLSQQLKDGCSQLSMDDLLKVLTFMIRIRVPVKSHFFGEIVQNISKNIKELNERDLVFLNHMLRKVPPIRTVKSIQMLSNLEYQLKYEFLRLFDLSIILFDCIESGIGNIGKILTEINENENLNIADPIKDLLFNLNEQKELSMDKVSYRNNAIMSECLEILSKHMMQLKTEEVITILSHVCKMNKVKFACKYNLSFPNAIVKFALNNNLPVCESMKICIKLTELNYASVTLCDHTIDQIVNHPSECLNESINVASLLHSIACCSRQNPQLANALDILMEHKQIKGIRKKISKDYFSLMYNLFILNYYQEDLVMNVTNEEFLSNFVERYPEPITHLQLLRIDHALSTENSSTPRVPDKFLEEGRKYISDLVVKNSLSYALLRQILDPKFVASNVFTSDGSHIDHLLILDQNNCPQELSYERQNGKGVNIADVYASDYHRVIAIIDIHPMRLFSPDDLISGTAYMKQKVLQNAGFHVVPLLLPSLHRLPKEDHQDFVKRTLRSAGVFIS